MKAVEFCTVCASEQLLAELREVLSRKSLGRYLSPFDREKFFDLVRGNFKSIHITPFDVERVDPRCRDPRDNFILALTLAAEADVLVSSDHDLLVLNPWRGVPILTPAEFLERFLL